MPQLFRFWSPEDCKREARVARTKQEIKSLKEQHFSVKLIRYRDIYILTVIHGYCPLATKGK
jgi:hypothetical protein